jgi:hypothetical protein
MWYVQFRGFITLKIPYSEPAVRIFNVRRSFASLKGIHPGNPSVDEVDIFTSFLSSMDLSLHVDIHLQYLFSLEFSFSLFKPLRLSSIFP